MTVFNYKFPVYEIDDDGDLKFIKNVCMDYLPRIGETLATFIEGENGKPIKRVYYKVQDILYPIIHGDRDMLSIEQEPIIYHVKLLIHEDVLNF